MGHVLMLSNHYHNGLPLHMLLGQRGDLSCPTHLEGGTQQLQLQWNKMMNLPVD